MTLRRAHRSLLAITSMSLVLGLASCSKDDASEPPAAAPASTAQAAGATDGVKASSASRALRITTDTTLASTDVAATVAALRTAVAESGGYVSDARTSGTTAESKSAELTARVPADKIAGFRARLAGYGDVVSDHEKAEDVTEQRADLKARLRNARAQEKRLLDLLSDRTGNLGDVIAAEKALAEARDTIERLEAQEQLLEGQIAYATVNLRVVAKSEAESVSALGRIGSAGSRGVTMLGQVAMGLVLFAVTVGPTALLLLAVVALAYLVARRLSKAAGWIRPSAPARAAAPHVTAMPSEERRS